MDTARELIDNKYEVLELLGKGGMCTVYKCRHIETGKLCAVKILTDNKPSQQELQRLVREARVLGSLSNPSIVKVHSIGLTDNGCYVAMDYMTGPDLQKKLQQEGVLKPTEFARYFEQLLGALQEAHAAGIVHRDLKPSNIIISPEKDSSGSSRAILIDFGIAAQREAVLPKLTLTDSILGTPLYMSPEQCSSKPADASSDIYSLGCVMFESAVGKPPFTGNAAEVMMAHIGQPIPPVPKYLSPLIEKCIAKHKTERFANAEEALEALKSLNLDKKENYGPTTAGAVSARLVSRTFAFKCVIGLMAVTLGSAYIFHCVEEKEKARFRDESAAVANLVKAETQHLDASEIRKYADAISPNDNFLSPTAAKALLTLAYKESSNPGSDAAFRHANLAFDAYHRLMKQDREQNVKKLAETAILLGMLENNSGLPDNRNRLCIEEALREKPNRLQTTELILALALHHFQCMELVEARGYFKKLLQPDHEMDPWNRMKILAELAKLEMTEGHDAEANRLVREAAGLINTTARPKDLSSELPAEKKWDILHNVVSRYMELPDNEKRKDTSKQVRLYLANLATVLPQTLALQIHAIEANLAHAEGNPELAKRLALDTIAQMKTVIDLSQTEKANIIHLLITLQVLGKTQELDFAHQALDLTRDQNESTAFVVSTRIFAEQLTRNGKINRAIKFCNDSERACLQREAVNKSRRLSQPDRINSCYFTIENLLALAANELQNLNDPQDATRCLDEAEQLLATLPDDSRRKHFENRLARHRELRLNIFGI